MSEHGLTNEPEIRPPELKYISLEQGEVIVRRISMCLEQNPQADLYILIDFGAEPLETVVRELGLGSDLNIDHIRITRSLAHEFMRGLGTGWKQLILRMHKEAMEDRLGKTNFEFLQNIVAQKKYIVLIDDIEYEGRTLDLTETLIRYVNPDCQIVRFPMIRSTQNFDLKDDGWPFALFDDMGMIKGYRMPWEENQAQFLAREADRKASLRTVSKTDPDRLAILLRKDLQKVTQYFKERK